MSSKRQADFDEDDFDRIVKARGMMTLWPHWEDEIYWNEIRGVVRDELWDHGLCIGIADRIVWWVRYGPLVARSKHIEREKLVTLRTYYLPTRLWGWNKLISKQEWKDKDKHGVWWKHSKPSDELCFTHRESWVMGKKHGISCWECENFDNEHYTSITSYRDGYLHGERIAWIPGYTGKWHEMWDDGYKHGLWKKFDQHGIVCIEQEWAHGNRHGVWRTYNCWGQLTQETSYLNDVLHGMNRSWKNHLVVAEGMWENGKREGVHKEWDYRHNVSEKTWGDGVCKDVSLSNK